MNIFTNIYSIRALIKTTVLSSIFILLLVVEDEHIEKYN